MLVYCNTLWENARVGCFKRTTSKDVYYLGWNISPAQVGCMRQVLRPAALGRPRGIGWRGRWEGGSGWGIHVTPWLIHVNVWQKPRQYCKVISLQQIKINEKKRKEIFLCMFDRKQQNSVKAIILQLKNKYILKKEITSFILEIWKFQKGFWFSKNVHKQRNLNCKWKSTYLLTQS